MFSLLQQIELGTERYEFSLFNITVVVKDIWILMGWELDESFAFEPLFSNLPVLTFDSFSFDFEFFAFFFDLLFFEFPAIL